MTFPYLSGAPSKTITVSELKQGMDYLGENLTEEEMKELLRDVQFNDKNEITFEEFAKMVIDEYPSHDV